MRRRQRGLSGVFVAVVLLIAAVGILAVIGLSNVRTSAGRNADVANKFAAIQDALVQFVSANGRLPCPANPVLDDGIENPVGGGACTNADGTVPWGTIGARRDDSIDPWGGKIAYRVYTGTGSLTQAGGASMVDCDTGDSGPADAVTGLCIAAPKDTGTVAFLAGKGFTVNDLGANQTGIAYVLISHGPSGLGAYSTNGLQRELPAAGGAERTNTGTGPSFVINAFSAAGTDSASVNHFDDYLAYRRIEDLIRAAGRYARNWPEEAAAAGTTAGALFDQATVSAAVGTSVTPGATVGQSTVNLPGVVASGLSGSSASDISFDVVGGAGGLGIDGGGSSFIQSSANESLRLSFSEGFTKLGITLNDFGIYSGTFIEVVQFDFYSGETLVGTRIGAGCNLDGGLASFSMDMGPALFDRVDITPLPAFDAATFTFTGITALLVTEVKTCTSSDPTCATSLTTPANTCTAS